MYNYNLSNNNIFAVIGRGGEQITRLQSETGCKIQMAPESGGLPERVCTLTGSREAVK
jgi:far upstream element-binding protein